MTGLAGQHMDSAIGELFQAIIFVVRVPVANGKIHPGILYFPGIAC